MTVAVPRQHNYNATPDQALGDFEGGADSSSGLSVSEVDIYRNNQKLIAVVAIRPDNGNFLSH